MWFDKYVSKQAAYKYDEQRNFCLSFLNSTPLISQWHEEVWGLAFYHLVAAALLPSSKVNKSKTGVAATQNQTTDILTRRLDQLFQSWTLPVLKGPQMRRTACAAARISSSASGVGCIIVKSQKLDKGEAGMLGQLEIFLDARERADGSETQILNFFFFISSEDHYIDLSGAW